ncbi:MAG: AAA domain-containing protein [Sutterella wadsworthensis]
MPAHLMEIVCPDVFPTLASGLTPTLSLEAKLAATAGEDPDVLLAKPANPEQLAIAHEVEHNNVVLVQGPPGTGKTHTIANLLGHFLSQGKRVLVTSHTTKALSVIKDLLPKEIQPLCVTMLGDRKDLEQTSSELITRLTRLNVEDLEARIRALGLERHRLGTALADRRRRIFEQRRIEHEAVEFNGRRYTLTEIAKFLREAERLQALIPGEVAEGPLPLSFRELLELYGTNGRWDAETARDLSGLLPGFELLPDVDTMRGMNRRWRDVLAEDAGDVTIDERRSASGERLHAFMKGGETLLVAPESGISALTPAMDLSPLTETDEMKRLALSLGLADEGCREAFEQLERELAAANELALAVDRASLLDNRTVVIPDAIDADAAMKAAEWFTANDPDGSTGFLGRLFNKEAREAADALSGVEVDGSRPASKEAFEAVALHARLKAAVKTVARTWDSLAERADAPAFATYGDNAVRTLFTRYGTSLSDTCIWWRRVFVPYIEGLLSAGIEAEGMKELLESADPLEAARRFATDVLAPVHTARHREAELHALREWQATESQKLYAAAPACATARRLAAATLVDPDAWELEAERLRKLLEDQPLFARRTELLERLRAAAPEWANALEAGDPGFTTSNPSPEITNAWLYRQLERIYTGSTAADLDALQSDAERLCADLREATAQLAVAKAWLAVKSRLSNGPALSNLFSLAAYMKRAVGRGRKSAAWRREVNRLLPACQQAVPVWIMMIQDALLNFSTASKFDVIVVDEASQADMTALPLLYMGKKVIVVGDDRQVTPLSVGTSEAAVDALCARHLEGRVKEPKLYDSRLSLYGLVQSMAFPAHMLVEHFRSVPEIIGWCSRLSYNGTIRPLRDASSSSLKPAVVPWRTRGTAGDNGVNEEEAQAVIRLLRAMIHDPAYDGKTFGIIPMRSVHGAQVNRIRRLLVENFDPREIERRRIHCGISAEFQGDERDVVILSLVDSAAPGLPLRKETDGADGMMKKRWNVAVSRARDQLWLVHSFDPAAQLKPDDLRRSLFDWADGVMSGTIGAAEPFDLPDPEFTGQVLRALRKRGYRVEAGHDAGAWRLDMVVRARGRAAAIECDGSGREDEDAIRRDMERQTVLERAGWKFVRVRSADWFRRPEKTLERVCEALAALGIAPEPEDCAPQTDLLLAHVRANVERLEAGLDMIVFDKEDEDPVPPVAPVTPADLAPDDAEPVVTAPVQFEAPLMPVEVEKADIMLIPEMEMRDAVRISLPTLSDVFDDEPAAEADAKTEDEAPNEPAAESCGDPHHTPVTFMEVIRDGLMDRGINPVLHTTPNDATMTIGGRTLLRATFWSGRADVLVPAFDDVKPRTCAGCRLVHNGAWRMWSLAEADLTQRFVQDFVVFIARTAEALR